MRGCFVRGCFLRSVIFVIVIASRGAAVVGYSHFVRVLMLGSQLATFSKRDHLVELPTLCSATFAFLSLVLWALRSGRCCS